VEDEGNGVSDAEESGSHVDVLSNDEELDDSEEELGPELPAVPNASEQVGPLPLLYESQYSLRE